MAEIVLTIPNGQVARAVDALCSSGGYSGSPTDQPARREFAREVVAKFIRQTVMQAERQQAMSAAMASVTVDPITID